MLSLARQRLHQHQPGSYSLLRLHPTVDLHDLLSTGQVPWKCVCVSERAFCFLGKVYTGLKSTSLFSSDSSSPNHQADPGSHGNSEVSDTPARTEQRCKRLGCRWWRNWLLCRVCAESLSGCNDSAEQCRGAVNGFSNICSVLEIAN